MERFEDFSTVVNSRRRPRKGPLQLAHLPYDHPPTLEHHSLVSKSPQYPRNCSLEPPTLSPHYSRPFFLEPQNLSQQEVGLGLSNARGLGLLSHQTPLPTRPSTSPTTSSKAMAPHGRPKLKRTPRESVPKSPQLQCLPSPASPSPNESANLLSPASPDPPRVKTPTTNRTSPQSPEPSREKSPVNDDRGSPDPNCAICLGKLRNKSFTDSCLHQFCFKCLVQWSKVKPECPLCKQGFKSIIHNVRSNEDYDQYHCRPAHAPSRDSLLDELLGLAPGFSRFRYRTTHVSDHRRVSTFDEATIHQLFHQHQNLAYVIPSTPGWIATRSRRQMASPEFRASIYNRDMWVGALPDITGRYRECSPEFYRVNQAQLHRLVPWLNREIPNVAPNNSVHAQLIIDLILSLLTQHHIQSRVMYGRLRPYFGVRTSHFLHEFHAFARSPYDLIGFDQTAVYGRNPNPTIYSADVDESVDDSDSDSDVVILDSDVEPIAGPSDVGPIAGPSGISRRSATGLTGTTSPPSGLTQEVADDSDDCEIVNYIKPRHERTPEIVVLSDTDEEVVDREPAGNLVDSWSRAQEYENSSLEADLANLFSPQSPSPSPPLPTTASSSASEYVPYTLRSSSKKSAAKKSSKKGSVNTKTKNNKSYSKATKMKARSDFSDSEEEPPRRRKKCKSRRNSRRNGRAQPPSPSTSTSYRDEEPGPSGFRQRRFSSDDSLNEHSSVVIPFLEAGEHEISVNDRDIVSPDKSTQRMWPASPSPGGDYQLTDLDYKPNATSLHHQCSFPTSPDNRQYSHQVSPPAFSPVKSELALPSTTWCIKPSSSNLDDSSDENATSPSSSGSSYHPRLKSIVIMRSSNSNGHVHTRHRPQSPVASAFSGRSHSPVASTSRTRLRSPGATGTFLRSDDRSLHSSALSSLHGKTSKYKYKPKSSKKESRRQKNRSDSDSSVERKPKKPRTSKYVYCSDDSSS